MSILIWAIKFSRRSTEVQICWKQVKARVLPMAAPAGQVIPPLLGAMLLAGGVWKAQRMGYWAAIKTPSTCTQEWQNATVARNAQKERESMPDEPIALNPFRHNYPASFKSSRDLED